MNYQKDDFYTGGDFNKPKAFQAYYDMMKRFGYPISPLLKTDQFWTSDFAQNDFLNVGMGGIFWVNDTDNMYFAHGILAARSDDCRAPTCQGTGGSSQNGDMACTARHGPYIWRGGPHPGSALHVAGQSIGGRRDHRFQLQDPAYRRNQLPQSVGGEAFHDRRSEGAIVSEYASPHYGSVLKFTNKTVVF